MAAESTTSARSSPKISSILVAVVTLVVACVLSAVVLASARVATGANRINPVTEAWFVQGWASNLVLHPGDPLNFIVRTNVAHQIAWRAVSAATTAPSAVGTVVASGGIHLRADVSQPFVITATQTRHAPRGSWLLIEVTGTARPLVIRVP